MGMAKTDDRVIWTLYEHAAKIIAETEGIEFRPQDISCVLRAFNHVVSSSKDVYKVFQKVALALENKISKQPNLKEVLKNMQILTAKYVYNQKLMDEFYELAKKGLRKLNFAELSAVLEIFSTINFQPDGENFFDFLAELAENMRNEFPEFSSCAINANKVVKLEMVLSNFQTYAFYPETLLNDKNVAEFLGRNPKELSIFRRYETIRKLDLKNGTMSRNSFHGEPFLRKYKIDSTSTSTPENEPLKCFDRYIGDLLANDPARKILCRRSIIQNYKFFMVNDKCAVLPIGRNRCCRGKRTLVNGRMATLIRILKGEFDENLIVLHQDAFAYHDSVSRFSEE